MITPPPNQVFAEGDNIDFVLAHPSILTVSGSPKLAIDIGGSSKDADYLTGSGTKNLTFRYTVQAGDNDSDGIVLPGTLDFNGATIQFSNAGALTDASSEILNSPNTSGVQVDTLAPILSAVTPPTPATFYIGESLQFIAVFDDTVYVTGTPRFSINLGSGDVLASYTSGSGSAALIFRYEVTSTDLDLDGIAYASPLNLNGGSIKDANGNDASLSFSPVPTTTTYVDGDSPKVISYTSPAAGNYGLASTISFDLVFNEVVNIAAGTPTVDLDIGGTTVQASLVSGSGTDTLSFQYIVGQGLLDEDGIEIENNISLNGATIQDAGGTNALLSLNPPLLPNVLVDSTVPSIVSIVPPTDGDYTTGQDVDFIVQFNEDVIVTAPLRAEIQLATGNVFAEYQAGSGTNLITLRYTVQSGQSDNDGILFAGTTLDLNTTGTVVSTTTGYDADLGFSGLEPTMTGINVNESTPIQLVITQEPTDSYANENISPSITVELRDVSNNLVTAATDTITVSLGTDPSAGTATLGGTLSVAAVAGVATFSDLNIDSINNGYTFNFTSGSLTGATSSSFNITEAPATQLVFTQDPTDAVAGVNINPDITVEFRDASNNLVPSETSNVTLSFGTDPSAGAATLGGTVTVAAVGGIATFNDINIDLANTGYTLTASSGVLTDGNSASFNITPAAASQLAFTVEPTDTDIDTVISPDIEVQIQDAFGNLVNSSDNVTLSINNNAGPGGTLGGTLTVAAVAGIASFNDIEIDVAGSGYTLDADSGVLSTATSNSFDINLVATQLVISQEPTDTEYSQDMTPSITVEIRDASNNLVSTATDTVIVSLGTDPSAGAATLGGTLSVAAVAGVATFSDLNIDTINTGYTLNFNSGSLSGATSTPFDILPATATQLVFTQDPTDAVAGVNINPDITVEFRDASNNLVTDETSNVTLSFGTDPSAGAATLGGTVTVAAVGGVATFNDINIDLANTGYTLTASSGVLTDGTSATFDITPAAASQLAFTVEPTDANQDTVISPDIEVQIQDAFGNLVNSSDNVTLSINNNAGPGGT
ncbi:MAG: hypothetical protein CME65_06820, partial [Halobacteriovoraceae bacterium]|nr:hypothetical protein [Halobacteriovoraceae bacterium]